MVLHLEKRGSPFPTGALLNIAFEVSVVSSGSALITWSPSYADVNAALVRGDCVSDTCDTSYPLSIATGYGRTHLDLGASILTPGKYTVLVENRGDGPVQGLIIITLTPIEA